MTENAPPKRGRGRPRKERLIRRDRAKSPFLLSPTPRGKLPQATPLSMAISALPEVPATIKGHLELADLPIELPGVRTSLTDAQKESAQAILQALYEHEIHPYANNSRRSIRADWRHWIAFCVVKDRVAMPIAFVDLKEFLDALIGAGYKRATLDHLLFTLKLASQLWSCPDPTDNLVARWYWQEAGRERLSRDQHQAASLNIEDLEAIAGATAIDEPRALRDLAFAAVAYDLMARASELVELLWEDIDFQVDRDGGATCKIARAKTDQEGKGVQLYLTLSTVKMLRAWEPFRFPDNPYVFHALPRYTGQEINRERPLAVREAARIFERLARRAGTDKPLSGHSARVGAAQDMTRADMDLPAIMQAGRWKSPSMPARYAAKEIASRAGKNRAAALRKLRNPSGNETS